MSANPSTDHTHGTVEPSEETQRPKLTIADFGGATVIWCGLPMFTSSAKECGVTVGSVIASIQNLIFAHVKRQPNSYYAVTFYEKERDGPYSVYHVLPLTRFGPSLLDTFRGLNASRTGKLSRLVSKLQRTGCDSLHDLIRDQFATSPQLLLTRRVLILCHNPSLVIKQLSTGDVSSTADPQNPEVETDPENQTQEAKYNVVYFSKSARSAPRKPDDPAQRARLWLHPLDTIDQLSDVLIAVTINPHRDYHYSWHLSDDLRIRVAFSAIKVLKPPTVKATLGTDGQLYPTTSRREVFDPRTQTSSESDARLVEYSFEQLRVLFRPDELHSANNLFPKNGFHLIGFKPKDCIDLSRIIGNTARIVANGQDVAGQRLFTAFHRRMIQQSQVAVCYQMLGSQHNPSVVVFVPRPIVQHPGALVEPESFDIIHLAYNEETRTYPGTNDAPSK
ncbi:X-ray repair cross-complementing protein 6 [Tieghemiomyces parasiticus]|uniref:X-ray repair cross-complementing protein 6 n=1 Tax=Tieghemiomyces parasiticus TaxID=78921 RepID=A0A9W8DY72_9FUNG|nr:X-ray repair cross-complementing protein 6 [Tieghemiomyces parasiticus]